MSNLLLAPIGMMLVLATESNVIAGEVASTVPKEIESYAQEHDCAIENVEYPQDDGPRYIYGILPGHEPSYHKQQDNAAVVCIKSIERKDPLLGTVFSDEATLLLMGVKNKFTCQNWLFLSSDATAAISIKDGTWDLSEFRILDNHSGEPGSWGAKQSVHTRVFVLEWYGGPQIGLLCHSGKWYGQLQEMD